MAATTPTRRRFLQLSCIVSAGALAGCSSLFEGGYEEDSDGDGVVDSEDPAPQNDDIQREEELTEEQSPTPTETETPTDSGLPSTTETPTETALL